jgi:hypothetical protein
MRWKKIHGRNEWLAESQAGNYTIKWDEDKSVYWVSLNGKPTKFFSFDLATLQHIVEQKIRDTSFRPRLVDQCSAPVGKGLGHVLDGRVVVGRSFAMPEVADHKGFPRRIAGCDDSIPSGKSTRTKGAGHWGDPLALPAAAIRAAWYDSIRIRDSFHDNINAI